MSCVRTGRAGGTGGAAGGEPGSAAPVSCGPSGGNGGGGMNGRGIAAVDSSFVAASKAAFGGGLARIACSDCTSSWTALYGGDGGGCGGVGGGLGRTEVVVLELVLGGV